MNNPPYDAAREIKQYTLFLQKYAAFETQVVEERLSADLAGFTGLFARYAPVDKVLNDILATTAPYYNIFSILNVHKYETKLHTPFLCHLLNASATHGQGCLFLNSFLKRFVGLSETEGGITHSYVYEERSTDQGRMDIVIEYRHGDDYKIAVIENKIYAPDQPNQLKRYHDYIVLGRGYKKGNFHILYLKPYRSLPSKISIARDTYNQLEADNSIFSIGYQEDVIPWLLDLLPEIKSAQLQNIINQYINTIKTL
jgi:hypothetical protein